jgi:MTH538 TIR-like domain (DUF1863)
MGHKEPCYVIFDGDNDKWAYAYMKGWKQSEHVDFDFEDAHDLDNMTFRAQGENYVKARLKERMKKTSAVIVLVGDSTKNLYKFVRWEIDLAIELGLPIIAVNLKDGQRTQDAVRVPPIIRDKCVVHVSFRMKIIKYALDNWPAEFYGMSEANKVQGARHYADSVYTSLGLTDSN